MWKWLLILFLVLAGSCVGTGFWLKESGKLEQWREQYQPGAQAAKVRITAARRGDLVRTVSAPGQVEPKTKVEISAQVSARIIALPFREGQTVKKDDVIVRLDGRDLAALLDSATNLQLEYNRLKELFSTADVAKSQLDSAETEYKRGQSSLLVAERAIDIARANIQRAEKDLENTQIVAPFDGVITKLNAEVGELVVIGTLNNAGSVIMEVADLGVMLLKTRLDEANIGPVLEGQKARVFVNAYPNMPMNGTIDHIGLKRQVDKDGTAYFETDILIDKPADLVLRSGLTANADIQVETFRDVIKVPSQAVLDRTIDDLPESVVAGNALIDRTKKFARVVYVIQGGKARSIPVKTGASDLTDTILTAGIESDAKVISGPFKVLQSLKDDQKVEIEDLKTPGVKGEQGQTGKPDTAKPASPDQAKPDPTKPDQSKPDPAKPAATPTQPAAASPAK
ncbi:MAG: efflux RND transporter periplasmic adaptor subunit [Planctomycetota bacterium]|nr:efflux RND transporter periplasmic adaptor subunit [Planctomycetota bacterium]